jgi:hypothetical protein
MQRNQLALGLRHGQVEGDLHWISIKPALGQPNVRSNSNALRPARGLVLAVPASLAIWAILLVGLLR